MTNLEAARMSKVLIQGNMDYLHELLIESKEKHQTAEFTEILLTLVKAYEDLCKLIKKLENE